MKKILIVDDSRAMRMLVTRALRQAGFGDSTILEACDGAAALELIGREEPDVVLSDWNMPNMLGIDLLRTVRGGGSQVRFGFITSEVNDTIKEQAREAGAAFLISKPFTADSVKEAITKMRWVH